MHRRRSEQGQIIHFFMFIIMALGLMTMVGLQIGRIVYARGEVGKASDAAALAAASRVDVPTYRDTELVVFLPDAHDTTQDHASRNTGFLASHGISVLVSQILIDPGSLFVYVSVSADLSSLCCQAFWHIAEPTASPASPKLACRATRSCLLQASTVGKVQNPMELCRPGLYIYNKGQPSDHIELQKRLRSVNGS